MPERDEPSGYIRCNSCAGLAHPEDGPLPTSHAEVCCLYKFFRQLQSPAMPEYYDGLNDCSPWNLKVQSQTMVPELEAITSRGPSQGISDTQEGIIPMLEEGYATPTSRPAPSAPKCLHARLRDGHKKKILDIRPPKFKKKLWFGTYSDDEVNLALDAVNYYTGYNLPFNYPDSPHIFSKIPLNGIKFEDVDTDCVQYVQVGVERELKYKNFAKQVKEVIHNVLGKKKKNPKNCRKKKARTSSCGALAATAASDSSSAAATSTGCIPPSLSNKTLLGIPLPEEEFSTTNLITMCGWDEVFTPEEFEYFSSLPQASSSVRATNFFNRDDDFLHAHGGNQ